MSLDALVELAISVIPVPGLTYAWTVFKLILDGISAVQASKDQLQVLAEAVAKLLTALNSGFERSKLIVADCGVQLRDLKKLLDEICQFVTKEQGRTFLKAFLNNDNRTGSIERFYQRIAASSNAFQISCAINIQILLRQNELARKKDMDVLHNRLQAFEQKNMQLEDILHRHQPRANNILDMTASLQRQLDIQRMHRIDSHFCSHDPCTTSTSGQQHEPEDWSILSSEIGYGPQIGAGAFGTVYRGTWNQRHVAIKVLRSLTGATPSVELMRQEIDTWLTLRHPNIVRFLGANILDDAPFLVMPCMPYNARQFLRGRPDFDPIRVLPDVSLGLQYLHSHGICHGDIKGNNILVEDSSRAVLSDFGLARIKSDTTNRSLQMGHIVAGSRNWMAPELLAGSSPEMPSDIYAFGMTIYELYTDKDPHSGIAQSDFDELVFKQRIRPSRPDVEAAPRLNDDVWTLAEQCWLHDPKARPLVGTILERVATMQYTGSSLAQVAAGNHHIQRPRRHTVSNTGQSLSPLDLKPNTNVWADPWAPACANPHGRSHVRQNVPPYDAGVPEHNNWKHAQERKFMTFTLYI
ncbi:kinase-like domain-containing protein [Mycena vitilis]|nr:kinase-like domain-containing protein [Mycena vitilis]